MIGLPSMLDPYIGIIKAVALVLAILAIFGAGHRFGAQGMVAKYEKKESDRKSAELAAIADRDLENDAIRIRHLTEKRELKDGYAKEIATSRDRSATAPRLRISAKICDEFAGAAEADRASGSGSGDSATRLASERTDEDFRALTLKVETIFAGCRVAQDFLDRNGMLP